MLLTLNAASLRPMLKPKRSGRRELELADLPGYTRETLGLNGLNMPTDLLKGLGRAELEALRDRSDKAGCATLLLIESDDQPVSAGGKRGENAIGRVGRVIEAGRLLGCSAVAVPFVAKEGDTAFEQTVGALQRVMEKADRRDMNVLIAPRPGLTAEPDRVTELIKRVGGFRIGTFPDFQAATESDDAESYLKRLTPYASAVSASTIAFEVTQLEPVQRPSKAQADGADDADDSAESKPDADDPLSRLEADIEALLGPEEDEGPIELVQHTSYGLAPLIRAVTAVGFDGNLAIDYRGDQDGTLGVLHARSAIEQAIDQVAAEG